jgi:predicted pyridoxine 5'-phosphate oxidase superfamily flavin-nucleotide-binding protein
MNQFQGGSRINQTVKTDIENSVLCWLATVDAAGVPNVSPKEIFDHYNDDRIIIADIASSNSVRNIQEHPGASGGLREFHRRLSPAWFQDDWSGDHHSVRCR